MKKIGIIGGIGWPSTIEYYRLICEMSQQYYKDMGCAEPTPTPHICIESLDMSYTVNHRGSSDPASWEKWDEYYNSALNRLVISGCEIIVIASITPHSRLNKISEGISVPIVSAYTSLGEFCQRKKINNLLILGTMPTMNSIELASSLQEFGINVISPNSYELKEQIVNVINNLYQHKIDNAQYDIQKIVTACFTEKEEHNINVCLGCTELPMAFNHFKNKPSFELNGINYFNSTVIHVASALDKWAKQ